VQTALTIDASSGPSHLGAGENGHAGLGSQLHMPEITEQQHQLHLQEMLNTFWMEQMQDVRYLQLLIASS
jgi:hypothetical protein